MTKKEAIKQLINDFENRCISQNWQNLDDIDKAICKALKINPKKEG